MDEADLEPISVGIPDAEDETRWDERLRKVVKHKPVEPERDR